MLMMAGVIVVPGCGISSQNGSRPKREKGKAKCLMEVVRSVMVSSIWAVNLGILEARPNETRWSSGRQWLTQSLLTIGAGIEGKYPV